MQEPSTAAPSEHPAGGPTVRLTTQAMACDFSVIMNPGPSTQIDAAGDVLELIHAVEGWLSIYRPDSEISRVNESAFDQPVGVRPELFELLQTAKHLNQLTLGAFDIASGRLGQLWRTCRSEKQLPTDEQLTSAVSRCGSDHLILEESSCSASFAIDGLSLDPGAIGKGAALDAALACLQRRSDAPREFLLHGGHSSLLAQGGHFGHQGWPVGIGNPLFTNQRLGTIVLENSALATSGSNIQFFRHNGRRYGHIVDPRTGWPVDGILSVTVFSPSAAVADALSTAFFVLGVEKARLCCENLGDTGAILIPFPEHGRKLDPVLVGSTPVGIYWDCRQVV
jgi:FAD:protein FMN transferase